MRIIKMKPKDYVAEPEPKKPLKQRIGEYGDIYTEIIMNFILPTTLVFAMVLALWLIAKALLGRL